jgi:ATP-dependent NAD(P)H-hydrate dehydratase
MQSYARLALDLARERGMFVVLDADGLWMIGKDVDLIKGYRRAVITPNVVEFKRLTEQLKVDLSKDGEAAMSVSRALGGVTVLQKGAKDVVAVDTTGPAADPEKSKLSADDQGKEKAQEKVEVDIEGGLKRCGGQGDILSGSVGTMLAWGKCYEDGAFGLVLCPLFSGVNGSANRIMIRDGKIPTSAMPLLAAVGGSMVTRASSRRAFFREGRGVVTQDMLGEIGYAFGELFGESAQGQDKNKL